MMKVSMAVKILIVGQAVAVPVVIMGIAAMESLAKKRLKRMFCSLPFHERRS
jgi:hypothetical protein